MARQFFWVGVLVVCASVFTAASTQAGVVEATVVADEAAAWEGFSPDFLPDWQGDTATVRMRPDIAKELGINWIGSVSGCGILFGDWHPYSGQQQRWTVNRVSSSTNAAATSNAQVELVGERYSASKSDSSSNECSNDAALARYAEVVTDTGWLLANGSAVAYQNADIGDRSLAVDGSFSAITVLDRAVPRGSANASGTSGFTATYSLERATPFSLDLDLARLGEADLCFRALDDATNEVLFTCETLSGVAWHFGLAGVLDAGQYTFELDGSACSELDSDGLIDPAGLASYNVALDFQAESYWVDPWGGDNSYGAVRLFDVPETARTDDCFFAWHYADPSPSSWWAIDSIQIADHFSDPWDDDRVLLLIDSPQSSFGVPEPSTPVLLALGFLTALALSHRRRNSTP